MCARVDAYAGRRTRYAPFRMSELVVLEIPMLGPRKNLIWLFMWTRGALTSPEVSMRALRKNDITLIELVLHRLSLTVSVRSLSSHKDETKY